MNPGHLATIWTARVAAAFFVIGLMFLVRGRTHRARLICTLGLLAYLSHVWCAFTFFYGWSHAVAYRETARQTSELFGVRWGGGLYLNYLFTVVWTTACLLLWLRPRDWQHRPMVLRAVIYGFLGFMVLNGAIVVWILSGVRANSTRLVPELLPATRLPTAIMIGDRRSTTANIANLS
jgi:hypothetical protein